MTIEQQWCWLMLLDLANEMPLRDGTLRMADGAPLTELQIIHIIGGSVPILRSTIAFCCKDKNPFDEKHRIEVWEDGTIELTNFTMLQGNPKAFRNHNGHDSPGTRISLSRQVSEVQARVEVLEQVLVSEVVKNNGDKKRNNGNGSDELVSLCADTGSTGQDQRPDSSVESPDVGAERKVSKTKPPGKAKVRRKGKRRPKLASG